MNRQALIEAIKEPLRLLVLAVIPFAAMYFTELGTEWALLIVVVLRFIDRYLHELGKETNREVLVKGITRF